MKLRRMDRNLSAALYDVCDSVFARPHVTFAVARTSALRNVQNEPSPITTVH